MESLVLIPQKTLEKIIANQELILRKLSKLSVNKKNTSDFFKFISEVEAQNVLAKKQTWFWKQRTEGNLPYSKVGKTIYYRKEDINKLIEDNIEGTF